MRDNKRRNETEDWEIELKTFNNLLAYFMIVALAPLFSLRM